MISVIMSSSDNAFESELKGESVEPKTLTQQQSKVSSSGDDEKVSLSLNSNSNSNSNSVGSDGEVVSRVSMHVDGNAGRVSNCDASLIVDFQGSEEETRVSKGVDEEANEFWLCEEKDEDEKSESVDNGGFSEFKTDAEATHSGAEEKGKVELVRNGDGDKKEERKKGNVTDYDSMLSMFDQFAANGKSGSVGYGYEIGDMVWGKVKSHPWWPGIIFNEAFAEASVRRTKREGYILVAFFGDSSYGWFDPAELIPFEANCAEKSKQTNSRTFLKAVEEAVDEVNRRRWLGLACRCRNPYNFRPLDVDGYFAVDVGDVEAGKYSAGQIKKARDSFQPRGMLEFIKQLALDPMTDEHGTIHFVQNKATVFAFRRAVFEEFDETYAQAFGAQPVRPPPPTAPVEPCRAPLSGRLVIAEALGKGKSSGKPSKSKDQVEKDKYLFKRRDEPTESKTHKTIHRQVSSSGKPPQGDRSVLSVKGMHPSVVGLASHSSSPSLSEGMESSVIQPVTTNELSEQEPIQNNVSGSHGSVAADVKALGEGSKMHTDRGMKKAKVHKRPIGDMNSESPVGSVKIKKRKKELGRETSFRDMHMLGSAGKGGPLMGKVSEKSLQISPVWKENSHVNHHQGNDDIARMSLLPDSVGTNSVVGNNSIQLELPQMLDDLRALALNPFHGAEWSCPAITRQVFLRFRSAVYQKSLSLLVPAENESKEASLAISVDNPVAETSKDLPSVKPPKPLSRLEDPTKGGRKRRPSDRQEEMAVKKKKKINDLKLLAAEKKTVQKLPEALRRDGKETAGKITAQTVERKAAQRTPEVQRGNGKELAAKPMTLKSAKVSGSESAKKRELHGKAANPIYLVMKFPPGAALPSVAELRAKFTRFGSMDHSGTRIFWKTSTCRVVFEHKAAAEAALQYATNTVNVFGNVVVRCHLHEKEIETPEVESAKVQKEDPYSRTSQSRGLVLEHRSPNVVSLTPQQTLQLKSCLKKPSNDDGGTTAGGNGNGRGRVKFMLGDEGSRTIADDGAPSHGLNYNSEKIHMVVPPPPSSSILPLHTPQFPIAPNNFHHSELASRNVQNFTNPGALAMPATTNIDIAQQMLSLLTKCKDVVNNLTGALGYVPYHPL